MSPDSSTGGPTAYQQIDSRPLTGRQKSIIALAVLGNISEFFDMFLIGFVVSLLTKPWNLTGFAAGTILACSGLGTVLGAILWGRLADKYGRKRAFFWCVLLFVVFTFVSIFTPDGWWGFLALLRVFVGIGVGGLNITSIPYVQEFVPAKHRGFLSGLASVFIPFGLWLGSMAQLAVGDNWRLLLAIGCVPVLLLIWLRLVPESPRFHQVHGQEAQARSALAWAMAIPVDQLGALPEIVTAQSDSYAVIFKRYLKPLVIVTLGSFCFIMGGFAIQSWGQTLLKDVFAYSAPTVAIMFMFVSLADLIGRLGSAWLADRLGRRWTLFGFGLLGAAGCGLAVYAISLDSAELFFVAILVIMGFGDGAFGILNAFGSEQFPNSARSTGLGLGYGLGATAKIIGPALMGVLVGGSFIAQNISAEVIAPAFTLFAICFALGAVIYLFASETKGRSLDQV
ncbi:MAG: MFS transporter [Propionibacteriaceae bacterium]|jgi:putative MFS transporter|nr:MFS transporter [Propionibacteriaceae bacterium]